jgi:hypothetical protein
MSTVILGVDFSDAYMEAMARAPVSRTIIDTLELYHPSWPEPIRIARDQQDLQATLEDDAPFNAGEVVTFTALPVDVQWPDESDDQKATSARLSIDGVSAFVSQYLDASLETLDPISVILREYASDDTSRPCRLPALQLELQDVALNEQRITASAIYTDPVNRSFPGKDYQSREYPGLVAA